MGARAEASPCWSSKCQPRKPRAKRNSHLNNSMALKDFPQQQGVRRLRRSLEKDRLAHAYLFNGTELQPPENLARTLAKTLNCEQPPDRSASGLPLDSCDKCPSCRRIEGGNHPDVLWLRP